MLYDKKFECEIIYSVETLLRPIAVAWNQLLLEENR